MPNTEPDLSVTRDNTVHVAVGVVVNRDKRVLVARRHESQHQGGLWEFPGGKVAPGETVLQALARELQEEVNIAVRECSSLLKIAHDYGDKHVLLDVMVVNVFSGEAKGLEGQPVKWVTASELADMEFPTANREIVELVRSLLDHRNH